MTKYRKYRDRLRNNDHQAKGKRSGIFYCVVCPCISSCISCISLSELKDRIRNGDRILAPLAFVLWLASFIQRFGMWLRLRKTPVKVPAYVISYGNTYYGLDINAQAGKVKLLNSTFILNGNYGFSVDVKEAPVAPSMTSLYFYLSNVNYFGNNLGSDSYYIY